jgi:hypothetical protein
MNRRRILSHSAMAVLGLALLTSSATAQQKSLKDQLIGAWSLLISDAVLADGTRTPAYGPNPNGIVIFDAGGHYALELARSNNPKFVSNNRNQATAPESQAVVRGSLAHFGTFSVDEAGHTLIFRIESSSFPNWDRTEQKRPFTITGDDLKWLTPVASGGGSLELYWRRLK